MSSSKIIPFDDSHEFLMRMRFLKFSLAILFEFQIDLPVAVNSVPLIPMMEFTQKAFKTMPFRFVPQTISEIDVMVFYVDGATTEIAPFFFR